MENLRPYFVFANVLQVTDKKKNPPSCAEDWSGETSWIDIISGLSIGS